MIACHHWRDSLIISHLIKEGTRKKPCYSFITTSGSTGLTARNGFAILAYLELDTDEFQPAPEGIDQRLLESDKVTKQVIITKCNRRISVLVVYTIFGRLI